MGDERVQAKTSTVATERKSDYFFPKSDSMSKIFQKNIPTCTYTQSFTLSVTVG